MDSGQYQTTKSILQGIITELFEEVPNDLHPLMQEHAHFHDLVSDLEHPNPFSPVAAQNSLSQL
jgi:hypothetical protein